eukprot:4368640-Amphidinium_carterae.1
MVLVSFVAMLVQIVSLCVRRAPYLGGVPQEGPCANKDVVLIAVAQEGYALQLASVELRNDREAGRDRKNVKRCGTGERQMIGRRFPMDHTPKSHPPQNGLEVF